jgi:hypothetical protein
MFYVVSYKFTLFCFRIKLLTDVWSMIVNKEIISILYSHYYIEHT